MQRLAGCLGWEGPRPLGGVTHCLQGAGGGVTSAPHPLRPLHFTNFISSVVSVFKVDKLKLREGKRLLLATQLLGGRTGIEPRCPELLVQGFLSATPLPPRPVGHTGLGPSSVLHAGPSSSLPVTRDSSFPLPCFQNFLLSECFSLLLTLQPAHHSSSSHPHPCNGRRCAERSRV